MLSGTVTKYSLKLGKLSY